MEFLKIVLLSIGAAVVYGILMDQVTARVCVEYFTIGHPPILDGTHDPTALAFGWGVIATWWVGLLLGLPLAYLAQFGPRPKLAARDLVKPLAMLLGCVGFFALLAGSLGFWEGMAGRARLPEPLAFQVPKEKHAVFLGDLWAHSAAYLVGFLGGIVLWVWAWQRRSHPDHKANEGEQ